MIRSALTNRLATLLFSSLLGWGSAAPAQTFSAFHDDASRIQVQAQAQLTVSPDMATLDARLWEHTPALAQSGDEQTDPQALDEARQRLEKRTAQLIRTLEKTGLTSEAISAGSLAVHPDHIQRPASQGETSAPVFVPRAMAMHADARESQDAAEYSPGEIRIDASVSVGWPIQP